MSLFEEHPVSLKAHFLKNKQVNFELTNVLGASG